MRISFMRATAVTAAIFMACFLAASSASAVVVFDKDVGGTPLKLTLFGYSQLTAEQGDGLTGINAVTGKPGPDDGLQFGADRVRIGYKVKWGKVFSGLQIDFNKTDSTNFKLLPQIIKDAFVGYKFQDAASVKVGMFKTPVGMDFNTSGTKLDITKRGMEKQLVLERSLGLMVSGRKIAGGLGYDIGYFNPTTRSSAVSNGDSGDQMAYAARIMYDMGKTFHGEVSYGKDNEAGGATPVGTDTEDYTVLDVAVKAKVQGLTLKAEYIDGSDVLGIKAKDQSVWFVHAGYQLTPMLEGVIRYYSGDEEESALTTASGLKSDTDLTNIFVGVNINLMPKKKHNARIQLNYVFVGGDEYKWKGKGGYKDDVILAQFQVKF